MAFRPLTHMSRTRGRWGTGTRVALACAVAVLASMTACARPPARDAELASRRAATLRDVLERFRRESRFPGAVLGAWFADGSQVVVASGIADRVTGAPMPDTALLHAGSVGKTLYAAWVLQLVGDRRVGLEDSVSTHLGNEPWYSRVPNAQSLTVRMLLNHTTGIPEYGSSLMQGLLDEPGRVRPPLEAVFSVLGAAPVATAGTKFTYSDVNYQLLQLVAERITGRRANDEISRRVLVPHGLKRIVAADRKLIPGLVQGYAGSGFFLRFDSVLHNDRLILDPTFEGGGGGFVSNAGDLARWMALFAEGKLFDPGLLAEMRMTVPAGQLDVGADARSGLGIEIADTPLGIAYGHGGFFPGYLTLALWYPDAGVSLAIQVNSSAPDALARPLREVLLEAASAVGAHQPAVNRQ
jgi:D-alanyl-D-alanine carboxypeptidase